MVRAVASNISKSSERALCTVLWGYQCFQLQSWDTWHRTSATGAVQGLSGQGPARQVPTLGPAVD